MSSSAVAAASRLIGHRSSRCPRSRICHMPPSCAVPNRSASSLSRSRQYPNACGTLCRKKESSQYSQQACRGRPFRSHTYTQRRYKSTQKKADASVTKSASDNAASAETADEAIRQTRQALQKLKETRGANRAQVIEEAFEAAKKQAKAEPAVNWTRLRTPLLFGAGLYLGLVLFGNHREEKRGSEFLAELRTSFVGQGSKAKDEEGGDSMGSESGGNGASKAVSSEYEKWRESRSGKEE